MKVAVVWNWASRLGECSFRFEEYVRGLEQLGHEATVVCPASGIDGSAVPTMAARDSEQMRSAAFWAEVGADVAIIPTFHQMSRLLAAVKQAGTRVVAIGDSDGQRGLRVYPWQTLQAMVLAEPGRRTQLTRAWEFLKRYVRSTWSVDPQDAEFLESTRLSDVVALASREAITNFRRFLQWHGAGELAGKLRYVPLAINRVYLECPRVGPKRRELVAVGRFGSAQKNGGLLARTLEQVLGQPDAPDRITIFDAGENRALQRLAKADTRVRWSQPQPPDVLAEAHRTARSIVVSSRWEGSPPHACWEAAAMGATVVSTPIPAFRSWSREGPFARVADAHNARALAEAVAREMRAWDVGLRDARHIAQHWRSQASGRSVCEAMLRALDEVSASPSRTGSAPRSGPEPGP